MVIHMDGYKYQIPVHASGSCTLEGILAVSENQCQVFLLFLQVVHVLDRTILCVRPGARGIEASTCAGLCQMSSI